MSLLTHQDSPSHLQMEGEMALLTEGLWSHVHLLERKKKGYLYCVGLIFVFVGYVGSGAVLIFIT